MASLEWVTQQQTAELLGVRRSAVPKMVRRGYLTPRDVRPSLSRVQVVQLAAARAAAAAEFERRRGEVASAPQPPDDKHHWLLEPAAAVVLGCTQIALQGRSARGRVPCGAPWPAVVSTRLARAVVRADLAEHRRQVAR